MGEKRKKPKIRFRGFVEDWEQRKVEELCLIEKGKQINKNKLDLSGKYYVLNGGINPSGFTDKYNTEAETVSISEGGNSCGYVNYNKDKFWSGGHNYTLLKVCINNKFLFQNLKKNETKIMDLRVGSGLPNIQRKNLGEFDLQIPLKQEEQYKIGILFEKIDNLITLHQHKYDKLQELKKSLLEKMFPQRDSNVPEIRFKEFSEAWEQRKLGDISNTYSGGTPSVGILDYYNGNISFIRSGEIKKNKTELKLTKKGYDNSSAKMVKQGDILYALYGATSGEVAISKITGAINQAILAIIPKEKNNNYFISQWLRKEKENIINTYLQGGQGNLSGNIVKELDIKIPINCDEQIKIGSYFKDIDTLITLYHQKLQKLKNIKKAMLEKMFI